MKLNKKEKKEFAEFLFKYLVWKCPKCEKKINLMYEYAVSKLEDKKFKIYCKDCYEKPENIVVWNGRINHLSFDDETNRKQLQALLKEKEWGREKALKVV